MRRGSLLLGCLLLLAVPSVLQAQYFGRNKVQWENFDFKVLKTEHFDIYYYGEKDPAIDDAARMAERWYRRLSTAFGHQFSERKPIVLYKNHADFQQTTTTSSLIGEGTGGFTDSFKNRVVMPLTGSYAETDHVLGHELVHVFQFDSAQTLRRGTRSGSSTSGSVERLPLWAVEGLAEYFSQGRNDPQTAMWLRDSALNKKLPDLKKLQRDPRFSPYQYGQAFWAYIGGRWGDETVTRLFYGFSVYGIEEAFANVLGTSSEDVFSAWHAEVMRVYQPILETRNAPNSVGTAILTKKRTDSDLNVAPSVSPDGKLVAFLSAGSLFSIDLFLADTQTGEVKRRLVSASKSPHFDALRFIDSAGDWSPDGSRLAFVVFEQGDNRIGIVDVKSRRVEERISVPGIEAISNPSWSPDGRWLAFSGNAEGLTDLYVMELETRQVRQLTDDAYADLAPTWSPDGKTIAFVTDRGPGTDLGGLVYHPVRLALIDVASARVTTLSIFEQTKHINPQFSPDGLHLYFIADPEGVADVFRYTLGSAEVARITRVATGVAGITDLSPAMSVAAKSGRLLYSVFENSDWNVYGIDPESIRGEVITTADLRARSYGGVLPPISVQGDQVVSTYLSEPSTGLIPADREFAAADYRPRLTVDYIGPPTIGIGADQTGLGVGGSLTAIFGDILGEHQVGFSLQGGSSSSSNSLFGGEAFYLNRTNRINWGVAGAHVPYLTGVRTTVREEVVVIEGRETLVNVVDQTRDTVTIDELSFLTHYPFSTTRRLEGSAGYTRYGFDRELERVIVSGNTIVDREVFDLGSPPGLDFYRGSVAFVGDSSFFGFVSPLAGTRYRFEAEAYSGDLSYQTGLADYRRYVFFNPVTVAFRGLHYGRYGSDSEDPRLRSLYLGQSTLVRGYDVDSFSASECTAPPDSDACPEFDRLLGSRLGIVNLELRVPLFGTEDFGLIEMPYLPTELLAFADAGVAWTSTESPELRFDRDTPERVPVVSYGVGARIVLGGYLPIHLYYAWPLQRPQENGVFGFTIAPGW